MVPDPATKHNDPEPDPFAHARKAVEKGFRASLERLKHSRLDKWTPEQLWVFYDSMEPVVHSELASPELLLLRNEIRDLIRPYLEPEAEPALLDVPEPESPNREDTWQQEYHHPQRPPSVPEAPPPPVHTPPSPFIDRVLCLYCEKFFWGQLLIRTATCPLCGQATLRQVGEWDLRHDPWFPFHRDGGAV